MQPRPMNKVIEGLRYDTEKATLIAHDSYWDGSNHERHGRNTYLYRTPNGRYFCQHLTQWQGEHDRLEPVSQERAIELYEGALREHELDYENAFPGVVVEDA